MDVAFTMGENSAFIVPKVVSLSPYQFCSHLKKKGLLQISLREFECLCLKTIGIPMKQVAKILGLSHRTVESHLYNLKAKNNLLTHGEVIHRLRQSGFFYEIIYYANQIVENNI